MELKVVGYEVVDRIATITLNRPERLNAWTGRMHHEYRWSMAEAEAEPEVRAVVVTGAGRGFCSGCPGAGVLPPDELLPPTYEYARIFAEEVSPASVRAAKAQLYADLHGDIGTAVAHSEWLLEEMVGGPDFTEGVAALTERRPPQF